jgi:hypothetical protein
MDVSLGYGSKTVLSNGQLSHRKFQSNVDIAAGEVRII